MPTVTFFPVTFFPTCPLFLSFLLLLSCCYPDWINGTTCITYFPNTCILTCPLLLSFLLLFSYLPTVSFSLLFISYCYPDWINGTTCITYFPNTCILTCPLLLSFLLLFFLLLFFLPETVTFFPVNFFSCYFLSVHRFMDLTLSNGKWAITPIWWWWWWEGGWDKVYVFSQLQHKWASSISTAPYIAWKIILRID